MAWSAKCSELMLEIDFTGCGLYNRALALLPIYYNIIESSLTQGRQATQTTKWRASKDLLQIRRGQK